MYKYEEQKQNIFTESGQKLFLSIRDKSKKLLKEAGSFTIEKIIEGQFGGSSWDMLACIDRLVELGEIKEITNKDYVITQHRIFVNAL